MERPGVLASLAWVGRKAPLRATREVAGASLARGSCVWGIAWTAAGAHLEKTQRKL